MEELLKIFQNYKEETDENREKAILGAIKVLIKLNDDRKTMREQLANTNRQTRRANKGLCATKAMLCNYIDMIDVALLTEEINEQKEANNVNNNAKE